MQHLPLIITAYFEAVNMQDVGALVDCFTHDAKVKDEGKTHEGQKDIAAWSIAVNEKYACQNSVKGWAQTENDVHVTVDVSGTFPGSPIELPFHFTLRDEKISELEIR